MGVKIITDSTSDIPESIISDLDIEVVPLNIHIGQDNFKHGVDIGTDEFYTKLLTGSELPKTSQPSPGEFLDVYNKFLDQSDAIVSIHVTSKLSGTYNSAIQAKSELNITKPIEVVDSAMNAVKQHVRLGQHITKLAIFITLVEVLWNSR